MILGLGTAAGALRDRASLPPHTDASRRVPPREVDATVQGVVVNPPRDASVAVRVEIITEPLRREDTERYAPADTSWQERDWQQQRPSYVEAPAELPPAAAAQLGSVDAQRAASAYRAHAEWQPYAATNPEASTRRLSVRA
jgi:hypothetical protein